MAEYRAEVDDHRIQKVSTMEAFRSLVREAPVLVMFTAKFCVPCTRFKSNFAELSLHGDFQGLAFAEADIQVLEEAADENMVDSLPTFCLFVGGVCVARCSGVAHKRPARRVSKMLRSYLNLDEGADLSKVADDS
mmetsp:Transcript_15866/g.37522  ORF Transcript_15866/g.37522 Transcript_15866/m.37522 type:complete len:135 (+) Transcript_15866:134-538(+)